MGTIVQEDEVTLPNLAEHLENAGWDTTVKKDDCLLLHTPRGFGFFVRLDQSRPFVVLNTYLPVQKDYLQGLDLVNTLNSDVFLPSFNLDRDNDLVMTYAVSYERGLNLAQFSRVVGRFSGVIEHVVDKFDAKNEVFAFPASSDAESCEEQPTLQ